jgi:hypothetical protein
MPLWKLLAGIAVAAAVHLSGAFAGPAMAQGEGQGPSIPGVSPPTAPGKTPITARMSPGRLFQAGVITPPPAGQFIPGQLFTKPPSVSP